MEIQRAETLFLPSPASQFQQRSPFRTVLSLPGTRVAKISKRQQVVKEIFESEYSYIAQLNTIVNLFLNPVRVNALLPTNNITSIFSNIEGILSVNVELFACMRQHSLAEAFSYLGPFLKLYSTYANNYRRALETLQTCSKRYHDFAMFITAQENKPECNKLSLSALLLTPVQRIPRYKLLLEELLKHTRYTHMDYSKLTAATQQIGAVASHINEFIRQQENFKKMLAIQNCLAGSYIPGIIDPGRRFIKEGKLMKVCRRKPKLRMVFLFSDMLLYARTHLLDLRANATSYESRGVMALLTSEVELLVSDSRAQNVTSLFRISSEENSLTFFSDNEDEVYEWAQVIEDTIRELQADYAPLLTASHMTIGRDDIHHSRNDLEGSYPLTPATPLSNLASDVFYDRDEDGTAMTEEPAMVSQPTQQQEDEEARESNGVEEELVDHENGDGSQPLLPVTDNQSATERDTIVQGTNHSKCCIIL